MCDQSSSDVNKFFDRFLTKGGKFKKNIKNLKKPGEDADEKYKRDYGDIKAIKKEFANLRLPEWLQKRLRSQQIQTAIYGDHNLKFPKDLSKKLSKDFFKLGWIEDFYFQIVSYDLLHSGELVKELEIDNFLRTDSKKLIMEIFIPLDHEVEFNFQKAYCFLRSFVDPYFENGIRFWNFAAVKKKMHFGEGDVQFGRVAVWFRHFQFFKMFGCLIEILEEARIKEIEFHVSYSMSGQYLEFVIKDIGELDLPNIKFDYFLWRHPLRFVIYGIDYAALKFFNFISDYDGGSTVIVNDENNNSTNDKQQ
jgi:hypothetical protein